MRSGELKSWRTIQGLSGLQAGFEFLERADLASLPMGKHEIQGDSVYALAMKSPSRAPESGQFESHRDYIDIQYLLSGEEIIGLAPVEKLQVVTPYDAAKDIIFYAVPKSYRELEIRPGHFAVFFPPEGHLPMCHSHGPHELHKVVVKVSMDYWNANTKR
jgi:YhcH/YjgK/YiaL family protein